jgi:hypothetical protein
MGRMETISVFTFHFHLITAGMAGFASLDSTELTDEEMALRRCFKPTQFGSILRDYVDSSGRITHSTLSI